MVQILLYLVIVVTIIIISGRWISYYKIKTDIQVKSTQKMETFKIKKYACKKNKNSINHHKETFNSTSNFLLDFDVNTSLSKIGKPFSITNDELDNNTYVIIDFETANNERTSACQIGIVKIVNGQVIEHFDSLIKPHPLRFVASFVIVHNIKENDVLLAPTFLEIWPNISHFFNETHIIIAHNAGFDLDVLRKLCEHYKINCPNFSYFCSVRLFKQTHNYPSNSLEVLAKLNQISFMHHNALADVLTVHKLLNLHFGQNYHFQKVCAENNVKIHKFYNQKWLKDNNYEIA